MPQELIHRFEYNGKRFAIDVETCFCFECDAISWDVLEYYPHETSNRIYHLLADKYDRAELMEVVGEFEWLRSSKSVLTTPKREDLAKAYEVERGLKRLSIQLSRETPDIAPAKRGWFGRNATVVSTSIRETGRAAVMFLLGRSGAQRSLVFEFVEEGYIHNPEAIAELCDYALRAASLAGKSLSVVVQIDNLSLSKAPKELEGHTVSVRLAFSAKSSAPAGPMTPPVEAESPAITQEAITECLRPFASAEGYTLARLAKIAQPDGAGMSGNIVVRPNHPSFGNAVQALDSAGFGMIVLDYDGAYVANPKLSPESMLEGLDQNAVYYAEQLLRNRYFRVDPIASLFWRIYNGSPLRRVDPVGTNELHIAADGGIYPCRLLAGDGTFLLGSLRKSTFDETRAAQYEDVGTLTTSACMRCWARGLCGGGAASLHHALTANYRLPHESWCEAQRSWIGAAVAAFHRLSSEGVHFDRVYHSLGRWTKPSLFTMARAALSMTIVPRLIEESDAELLTKWESWNDAAYFTCNETGLLLPTRYDREMEALHPGGVEQEFVLQRRSGEAFGLFKLRPERTMPGIVRAWLHFRSDKDYVLDANRKGFRAILKETSTSQMFKRLLVPVSHQEAALGTFLEAVGFTNAGVQREALYLHGRYHDVKIYTLTVDTL